LRVFRILLDPFTLTPFLEDEAVSFGTAPSDRFVNPVPGRATRRMLLQPPEA